MGYRLPPLVGLGDVLTTYHCRNSGRLNVLNQYSTYSEKCPYNSECLTFTPIPPFSDLFHHTLPSFPFVSGPWKLNHFHVILPLCPARLGPWVFLGQCFPHVSGMYQIHLYLVTAE